MDMASAVCVGGLTSACAFCVCLYMSVCSRAPRAGYTAAAAARFATLLRGLQEGGHVETAVLACTELPLLVLGDGAMRHDGERAPVDLVDPTKLLAVALLRR